MSKNIDHIQHLKSNVVIEGKPKLPQPGYLVEGELAVNYAKGYETISLKNASGEVVTFSADEYYTEQKLGSGFTGANSARTVTSVIAEDELAWSIALNTLNDSKFAGVNYDSETNHINFYDNASNSGDPMTYIDASVFGGDVKNQIDYVSGITSAHTADTMIHLTSGNIQTQIDNSISGKVNTSDVISAITSDNSGSTGVVTSVKSVYDFVTSYAPSITVDQVLNDTTSASTNPVSSKAVYDAVTDNELVWTNAYVTLSGVVSSITENLSTNYYTKDETSAKTEISTALGAKVNSATYTEHTADTSVHFSGNEKEHLDSLATNIATISGITSEKVTSWDTAATSAHNHTNKTYLDGITGTVGTMAYENASSYSSATEVNTALGNKANTATTLSGYGITDAYTKTEIDNMIGNIETLLAAI